MSEGLCTSAQPGGATTRVAYETLRDTLLDDVREALPVDVGLQWTIRLREGLRFHAVGESRRKHKPR